jgi:hypothetical protein
MSPEAMTQSFTAGYCVEPDSKINAPLSPMQTAYHPTPLLFLGHGTLPSGPCHPVTLTGPHSSLQMLHPPEAFPNFLFPA